MFLIDTHVVFCKSVTMLVIFIVKQQFYCRSIIFTTSRLLEKSGKSQRISCGLESGHPAIFAHAFYRYFL